MRELRRSNSMSKVHATSGGGIRSRARLQIGTKVWRSHLWVAGHPTKKVGRLADGRFTSDSLNANTRLSANDAEVYVIDQIQTNWAKNLEEMTDGQIATIEFHGNHGPCSACQQRIERLLEVLSISLWAGTKMNAAVYYTQERSEVTRGEVEDHYGYDEKTPGFQQQRYTYGTANTELYCFKFPEIVGKRKRKKTKSAVTSATKPAAPANIYEVLSNPGNVVNVGNRTVNVPPPAPKASKPAEQPRHVVGGTPVGATKPKGASTGIAAAKPATPVGAQNDGGWQTVPGKKSKKGTGAGQWQNGKR
ncbi:hypothetical protein [Pseudoduganella sp.]|uniref:hypothetical protein n=1 Tax=Pseudoduganella sp. TaxID=1880898 RepID=UPI0035ADE84E